MKLLLCQNCWDVFKLTVGTMRTCECGKVKGRYINNIEAEVSENAISLALGNGALEMAIGNMMVLQYGSNDTATRDEYLEKASIIAAWVRPNTGDGNPHTKLIKEKNKK